jgi:cytosine/creatinine deaminase
MKRDLILRGGRVLQSGASQAESLDVLIEAEGRILAIAPQVSREGAEVLALDGRLVVPGLVDMHQHLDKSRTRKLLSNPEGTLDGAIAAYRAIAAGITREEMIARARGTVAACSARGTVAIRSHTNIDPPTRLRGIEAMLALRESCAGHMRIQVVGHVTSDATSMLPESEAWLMEAIALGMDAIGGVPAYSSQPLAFLKMLFDVAERSGLPLDLHIDEHLDAESVIFDALADLTTARGMAGRVVAGHCSALSAMPRDEALRVIERLHKAGVAVVTLPAANLFLQGRSADRLAPRGLTRIRELLDAGVPLAAASDNIEDAFVPTGSGDLLEIARWTVLSGHLGLNDLRTAFDMVTRVPAALMGLDDIGVREGARADLLIARAESVEDLVAAGTLARTVMVGGRIVASSDGLARA